MFRGSSEDFATENDVKAESVYVPSFVYCGSRTIARS
jgi:hypothetical protein